MQPTIHFRIFYSHNHPLLRHLTIRIFQLALLCFICVAKSYGQTSTRSYGRIDVEITKEKKPKKIYAKVEIKRAFPGGDSSWVQSLEKQLNESIQVDRRVKKGKYVVSVQFIITEDSSISDIRILNKPVGFGIEEKVMRALKKGPTWRPAPYPVKPYRTSSTTRQESN